MTGSWRTTMCAVIAAGAGGVVAANIDPMITKIAGATAMFVTSAGLYFARDNKVTSEEAGATPQKDAPRPGASLWVVGLLGAGLMAAGMGCATTGDPVVVNIERAEKMALPTFQKFLHFERTNPALAGPEVHQVAQAIRLHGLDYLQDLEAVKERYKASRTPENKATLETAFAAVNELLDRATAELGKAGVK